MPQVKAFECGIKGTEWTREICAETRSKARYRYLLDLWDSYPDFSFKDITVRCIGAPRTDSDFERTARNRGVPFAKVGMKVECEGRAGVIVGRNNSANFDVLFTEGKHSGQVLNCHPNWMMRYFDNDGNLIKEFLS